MSRASSREPRPLDDARLGRWLDEVLGGHHPIRTRPLKGGGSCEIWSIERDGRRLVLRRAPPHASSSTAHDVLREHRILHAIRDEDVRIARPVAACDDPTVAGAPFYVMEFVDGVPIRQTLPEAYADSPEEQTRALQDLARIQLGFGNLEEMYDWLGVARYDGSTMANGDIAWPDGLEVGAPLGAGVVDTAGGTASNG